MPGNGHRRGQEASAEVDAVLFWRRGGGEETSDYLIPSGPVILCIVLLISTQQGSMIQQCLDGNFDIRPNIVFLLRKNIFKQGDDLFDCLPVAAHLSDQPGSLVEINPLPVATA